MYSLFKLLTTRDLLVKQLPTFSAAFLIAELFYKFHSFTLECIAFLVTWFVFDAIINRLFGESRYVVVEKLE